MIRRRSDNDALSISFLDVITCGFGAIILLLVIAKIGEPVVIEPSPAPREGSIRELQKQLFEIRGEIERLNRELNAKHEQIDIWDENVAILRTKLAQLKAETSASQSVPDNTITEEGKLRLAIQTLTEEMKRLQENRTVQRTDLVAGIPVDSEYIIIIIDTSGSMVQFSWNRMLEQVMSVLNAHPTVKGIQIMNDEGRYMFSEYRGRWMQDNAARRRAIEAQVIDWHPFSNSSPVEAIAYAVRTYYSPDKKISIYYFGDDFPGRSVQQVVDVVERYNQDGKDGKPMVRIHGVGFPALFDVEGYSPGSGGGGAHYATLMRELARHNAGGFVGLDRSY